MAPIFSPDSCDLRGRSAAIMAGIIRLRRSYGGQADPGYNSTRARCLGGDHDADLANEWFLRFSVDLDVSRACFALVFFAIFIT